MATLSASEQAAIQSAIDYLVVGTAVERPLDEGVAQRLTPLVESGSFLDVGMTSGDVYAALRDRPFSSLIALAMACGELSAKLTEAQEGALGDTSMLMISASAVEQPFDAGIIQQIGEIAAATGFLTNGGFKEAMRDNPVSTMLRWALFLGQ
jgi:hypothetical protein